MKEEKSWNVLDVKKVFDTMSIRHKILLNKFENIGIRGIALDLFRSYLTNRYETTHINKVRNYDIIVTTDILKCIGLLLFIILLC